MAFKSQIDYITTSSTGNASDFGDVAHDLHSHAGSNGDTYGGYFGGYVSGVGTTNDIEYVTMSSTANAQQWGNLSASLRELGGLSNATIGVRWGGENSNTIEYWGWASTGDYTDFGDLAATTGRPSQRGVEDTVRGIGAGGQIPSANSDYMEYITFASTGNATEFGDLVTHGSAAGVTSQSGSSNGTRGEFWGGKVPYPSWPNTESTDGIQYITIASLGNATDAGNLAQAAVQGQGSGQGSA